MKFQILFLILVPLLAVACVFKMLLDKQPVNVNSSNTNIVNLKEDDEEN